MNAAAALGATTEVAPAVLARARRGDPVAFGQVVRHYDSRLRGLAYRMLGSRPAMDDVLQEAYVKAFKALSGFRGESTPGTWLYRIVYRCCIDALRKEARDASDPVGDDWRERPSDPEREPGHVVAQRADLAEALARLPVDQRSALLLIADGLDYAAAADVLGVAPGTVASRASRARAALRSALADGGDQ
ncbi:MAG: RNA polymerase sigma factor [Acidimicrobiia bacterium]